jgi:ABC-type sugar transport system ATPase subunit
MSAAATESRALPLLSVRGIRKSFDGAAVLHGIDLDLYGGEILALVGENGAGKSTLLNIVSGALAPDTGSITLEQTQCRWSGPRAALQAGVAIVHQELSAIRSLSVAENIFLGYYCSRWNGFINRPEMVARARPLLDGIGARHIPPTARMDRLSLADQQLVEIAKALAGKMKLLMMDEPTSSLTPHEAGALFDVMRTLRARGVALAFISHRLDEVFAIADRIVVLRDGRLISDRPAAQATREGAIHDMTGRLLVAPARSRPAAAAGAAVLSVSELTDGRRVGPVSFDLRAGELLGVFGLVGAGRTELLELLAGARSATRGTAVLPDGGKLPASVRAAWARGVALLPEDRKGAGIVPSLSVLENLMLSRRQLRRGWLDRAGERADAGVLMQRLDVRAAGLGQRIRHLSGGNQQKVLLARCLATQPSLLLLDEPTRGVDVRTKAQIYALLSDLAAQGLAVVFASSELPEVLALSTAVLVLAKGRQTLLAANEGLSEARILSCAFAVD